jgi:hypothetical protein
MSFSAADLRHNACAVSYYFAISAAGRLETFLQVVRKAACIRVPDLLEKMAQFGAFDHTGGGFLRVRSL